MREDIPELAGLHFIKKDEHRKVRRCAERAFARYPSFAYICGGGKGGRFAGTEFAIDVKHQRKDWIFISPDEEIICVGMFYPPESKKKGAAWHLVNYMNTALFHSRPGFFARSKKLFGPLRESDEKWNGDDAWYLFCLMVDPDMQGKGISKKITIPMFEYLDRIDAKCYLETLDPDTVPFYKKYGFVLMGKYDIPDADIALYPMVRPRLSEREKSTS